MTLKPVKFEVEGHTFKRHSVYIESRGQKDGSLKWICSTGSQTALNDSGQFEYEPLPSNRDEDFIARTRFNSPEAALENFAKHMPCFDERVW